MEPLARLAEPDPSTPRRRHTAHTALCNGQADPIPGVAFLESHGWRARTDTEPQPLPLTVEAWSADPFGDRNWRFQLHAWRPIDLYIRAHDRTDDVSYLERAFAVIRSWVAAEAIAGETNAYWNDMGSGIRAAKLAYIMDRLPPDHPDRPWLRELALRHIARLVQARYYNLTNHSLFQIHGLVGLLDAMPDAPGWDEARTFAETMLDTILDAQFGKEGVHLEHSPGYHFFAVQTLRRMLAAGWYETMPHLIQIERDGQRALPWLTFPDGKMAAVGDTERVEPILRQRNPPRGIRGRLFAEAGYALVRSGWSTPVEEASMLLVNGAHHSSMHKHADDLSFEWFERGRRIIVDAGKYTYSHNDWRAYTDSARAHNSIDLSPTRDDNGLMSTPPAGGLLSSVKRLPTSWRIKGAIDRPSIGARHRRTLEYDPGKRLEIFDTIWLDHPGQVTAWLHLAPDLIARPRKGGWRFNGGRIRYAVEGAKRELIRVRGQMEPQIQGWCADRYHHITENDALGVVMSGKTMKLHTVITLDPPEGEAGEAD
jgi:hypothetical protein